MTTESTQTQTRPKRSRKQILLSLLLGVVILLCGGIIGSGLTLHFLWGRIMTSIHNPDPDSIRERLANRIDRLLDLDEEQRGRIETILREKQPVFFEIRAELFPRVNAAIEDLHQTIGAELTEEQRQNWDSRLEYLQELFIPERYRQQNAP